VTSRTPSSPIRAALRALRRLQKEQDPKSVFVFVSEHGAPFTRDSFNWIIKRAGKKARLPLQVHAHMLRHSTGYKLANDGADTRSKSYLGHRDIRHTVRYTELSAKPFRDFFRD
jgi:type 1 fimbriae regulatory protein FimB/type 1 fimbriae regulatory protein FimE